MKQLFNEAPRGKPRGIRAEFFRSRIPSFASRKLGATAGLFSSPSSPPQGAGYSAKENNTNNQGTLLVWVTVAMVMMLSAIITGLSLIQTTQDTLGSQLAQHGQATNMAKAGLLDALAWFRRQTTQPVTVFNPQLDLMTDPIINDTDDPVIGIVRELEIDQTANIWGRYEVQSTEVADISAQRGMTGSGTMWYIEARGIIYFQQNPALAYNVFPNRILAEITLATEIRRLSIVLPSASAICANRGDQVSIGNKGHVRGGDFIGIVYPPATGSPSLDGGSDVTGTPAMSQVDPYYNTTENVFGMTQAELRSIADYYVTDINELPNPIPDYKIVFFEGSAAFTVGHPMHGMGIFYITGNLTIPSDSTTSYNGVIYINGNYQQNDPSMMNGSIIAMQSINISGSGDIAETDYDPNMLQLVLNHAGQYRYGRPIYEVKDE